MEWLFVVVSLAMFAVALYFIVKEIQTAGEEYFLVGDNHVSVVGKPGKAPRIVKEPGWKKMRLGEELIGKFCVSAKTCIPFKPFPTADGFGIPVTANITWLIPPERYLDHAANPGPELRDIISSAVSNFIARYKVAELLMGNHDELNAAFCAAVKDLAANYDYQVSAATITVEDVPAEAAAACELVMGITQPAQPLPAAVAAKETEVLVVEAPLPSKEVAPAEGIPVSIEPEDDDDE